MHVGRQMCEAAKSASAGEDVTGLLPVSYTVTPWWLPFGAAGATHASTPPEIGPERRHGLR